jgi:hypothetical protein
MSQLWDVQVLAYVGATTLVVIMALVVLAIITRRLRCLTSELESIRRDVRLLEEGVATVTESLKRSGRESSQPRPSAPDKPVSSL